MTEDEKISGLKDALNKLLPLNGKPENYIVETIIGGTDQDTVYQFRIYTDRYLYRITAIDRPTGDGYLGCTMSCRKPRAGEDWERGNDLPDGPFVNETWLKILEGIIRNELVGVSKRPSPQPDAIDTPAGEEEGKLSDVKPDSTVRATLAKQ